MTQDEALDLLKLGENVFLTGAAGAGKTWLLNKYIAHLRAHGVGVAITASTGIAATHINGRTLHSWSGIGVRDALSDADLEKLLRNKRIRSNYTRAKVLVIDEISMLHPQQLDMVDRIARGMLDNDRPFGGLQVILCGDFFQLPPVARRGTDTSRRFAFYAVAWQTSGFRVCYLHGQHRQGDDPLLTILNDIRAGSVGEHSKIPLRTRYKREPEGPVRATRLYARNINVDSINDEELVRIEGEEKIFTMENKGFDALVDGLKKSCLAPEELHLKVGAEVMFVKNAVDGAYVNGTRGTVEGFDEDEGWPQVRTFDGDLITTTPVEWKQEDNGVVRATIIQVPLRLAWAITIHKSQGMTLDAAEIDLSDAFEPGMGYVGLSRVRRLNGLKLMGLNDTALQVNVDVKSQDVIFQQQSIQAQAYLRSLADKDKQQCQRDVLEKRFEGSSGKAAAPKRKRPARDKKTPTHEITLTMLNDKIPLPEIARQRQLALNTILGHLEKLKGLNALPDITYLMPPLPDSEFKQMIQAFQESEDGKLTSVHEKFAGQYSFEDLRIARLFAW
jgi:ATP-dependent exoDNAse (exonuclease V) alpha subunit